jgi:carbon starvation protein
MRTLSAAAGPIIVAPAGRGSNDDESKGWSVERLGLRSPVAGAAAFGGIALNRGESINALWFVVAAVCTYLIGYRFYSGWIAARVCRLDSTRATPAERLNNGRDFMPTHRSIVFGHHFAAIAGAGPLIGPTLAAQFGYLPGTLWLLVGAVTAGCVQDMLVLFCSTRRDGRSLANLARDELGKFGASAAMVGTLLIMVILMAVLALVVVKAMAHSAWSTATVFATIPIALLSASTCAPCGRAACSRRRSSAWRSSCSRLPPADG